MARLHPRPSDTATAGLIQADGYTLRDLKTRTLAGMKGKDARQRRALEPRNGHTRE